MKRKLISYDVFTQMERDSLSHAEAELVASEPVLARAIQVESLKLRHYGPESVLYEAEDGTFVHAQYSMQDKHVKFENIEQLVINEETEKVAARGILSSMIDSLIESNEEKAGQELDEYLSLPVTRRIFNEKKEAKIKNSKKEDKFEKIFGKKKEKCCKGMFGAKCKAKLGMKGKRAAQTIGEWNNVAKNILDYVDIKVNGPALKESIIHRTNDGQVAAIAVPTLQERNNSTLQKFNWKTLETDSKVLRKSGKVVAEDIEFCKAVAELKRHNAISDNNGLIESIEYIVSNWPSVLYLTHKELSGSIKEALEVVGAVNYDDQTCEFMAEGILRVAHGAYTDKVEKIMKLAGVEITNTADKYEQFEQVVSQYYKTLDENDFLEMQVFVDLYEAIREVHEIASQENNNALTAEASEYLNDLAAVIRQEFQPTLELAADAAGWLNYVVETNLNSQDWNAANAPYISVTGEHPILATKARQSYAPASDFSGNFNDPAPVSQGDYELGKGAADAQEMRGRSWGNEAGPDIYPDLKNPYVPQPFGTYTMNKEKGVDKASDATGQWSSTDTWPNLQNPYVPKSVMPKLNQGKESNIAVED